MPIAIADLPSPKLLAEAWDVIVHLSYGQGPCTPEVADNCRQLVLKARAEKEPNNQPASK